MRRERVADDIYVFSSEMYAQVTAGAIVTSEGTILIDTLVFPEETKAIRNFLKTRLNTEVRYVINTHYHADHTYGTYLFPDAFIISHALCHDLLDTRGREGLQNAQQNSRAFREIEIRLPHLVFESGIFEIRLGGKTIRLRHSPGHSDDSIVALVKEDRVLFAADTLMPVPYFVDGDYNDFIQSLSALKNGSFENVVQGHGEVILRGEVESKIESDLAYLLEVNKHVQIAMSKPDPKGYVLSIDIEQCGKSRIPLNGGVQDLHRGNMLSLLEKMSAFEKEVGD